MSYSFGFGVTAEDVAMLRDALSRARKKNATTTTTTTEGGDEEREEEEEEREEEEEEEKREGGERQPRQSVLKLSRPPKTFFLSDGRRAYKMFLQLSPLYSQLADFAPRKHDVCGSVWVRNEFVFGHRALRFMGHWWCVGYVIEPIVCGMKKRRRVGELLWRAVAILVHVLVTGSDYLVLRGGDLIRDEVSKGRCKVSGSVCDDLRAWIVGAVFRARV